MRLERHILRLLLAVIVMIAANALPSAASAHESHGNHGVQQSHRLLHANAVDPRVGVAAVAVAELATSPNEDGAQRCRTCSGCGAMGCCAAGVILPSTTVLPLRVGDVQLLTVADMPTPSGIGPEALPEPPRPSA